MKKITIGIDDKSYEYDLGYSLDVHFLRITLDLITKGIKDLKGLEE